MSEVLLVGDTNGLADKLGACIARECPTLSVRRIGDASAAIEHLKLRPADVILAFSGGDTSATEVLLRDASENVPHAMRIVLAPPDEPPPEKVPFAHQVLAARDDIGYLVPIVEAAILVAARAAQNKRLQRVISELHDVPSPPTLYFDIREQIENMSGDLRRMAEITAKDPSLVARILRIANSGFYGLPRSVSDLSEALGLIGTDALLGMVLAAHLYAGLPPPGLKLEVLWQHTLRVSSLARQITRLEGGDLNLQSVSAVAGLLHDIGMLVLLENEPARYQPLWRQSAGDEQTLARLEVETFGVTHGELGALILMLWSLPESVVQAVADSHAVAATDDMSLASRAVMAAEWLLDQTHEDITPEGLAALSEETLTRWRVARDEVATQNLAF